MIDYVKGSLADLQPARAIVECNGVGYDLNISLTTYAAIQGLKEAKLYVYEQVREDAWVLFGFSTTTERDMFLLLISVSGVGAMTARMMLSSMTPRELASAIGREDVAMLKSIKGIGARTAQRIVVELKDKVATLGTAGEAAAAPGAAMGEVAEEAISALTMLGFAAATSRKVVASIVKKQPALPVEDLIKTALKEMR
jgi:Holliday junction DNA helicase RuvA